MSKPRFELEEMVSCPSVMERIRFTVKNVMLFHNHVGELVGVQYKIVDEADKTASVVREQDVKPVYEPDTILKAIL